MLTVTPGEVPASAQGAVVTIGAFDGVHLGHRMLIRAVQSRADALGVPSAVVTFDRHPATIIRPTSAPLLLTDGEQKLELLEALGVDLTVVVTFDAVRAAQRAEDFVDEVIVDALGATEVVVGRDFHFGRGRAGNVDLLRVLGAREHFSVEGIELSIGPGTPSESDSVSSTRIRRLIERGDVAQAASLLARPHEVRGAVVHGDARGGAELGMPTANVSVPETIALPGIGIYAGVFRRADGSSFVAALSVGTRPTFSVPTSAGGREGASGVLLEAHLLDFDGDLYGERVSVSFLERLRDERRFERVSDLVSQMRSDVEETRSIVEASDEWHRTQRRGGR